MNAHRPWWRTPLATVFIALAFACASNGVSSPASEPAPGATDLVSTAWSQRLIGDVARAHAAVLRSAGLTDADTVSLATAAAIADLSARTRQALTARLAGTHAAADHNAVAKTVAWDSTAVARQMAAAEMTAATSATAPAAADSSLQQRAPLYVRLLAVDGSIEANLLAVRSARALARELSATEPQEPDAQALRDAASLIYMRVYAGVPVEVIAAAAEHLETNDAQRARALLFAELEEALPDWLAAHRKRGP